LRNVFLKAAMVRIFVNPRLPISRGAFVVAQISKARRPSRALI
jgi:hypothetical protein